MKNFFSINPFDQSIVAEHAIASETEVDKILQKAEQAFEAWSEKSFTERSEILFKAGEILRSEKNITRARCRWRWGKF
jgi:succinate-semialdehyde dehydrogenase/glutarate-semialdehyde dehydrogenase